MQERQEVDCFLTTKSSCLVEGNGAEIFKTIQFCILWAKKTGGKIARTREIQCASNSLQKAGEARQKNKITETKVQDVKSQN